MVPHLGPGLPHALQRHTHRTCPHHKPLTCPISPYPGSRTIQQCGKRRCTELRLSGLPATVKRRKTHSNLKVHSKGVGREAFIKG
jgi:hypothetical protein